MSVEVAQRTAAVALLRNGRRPWSFYADALEEARDPHGLLQDEHGLLADRLLEEVIPEIARWEREGLTLLTVLDADYPPNLRAVHDRPPLIFVSGRLESTDERAVAVIGARRASAQGLCLARDVTSELCRWGFTVVSGLAKGVDSAVHCEALQHGRTLAVVGTGVNRFYPPQNRDLQLRIASAGAVISPFWPDAPPTRKSFPQRNAVMSGLSLATVIVEAGPASGTRVQARLALAHGRPVLLLESLLNQPWASELAARPGAHVIAGPEEAAPLVERLSSVDSLVE